MVKILAPSSVTGVWTFSNRKLTPKTGAVKIYPAVGSAGVQLTQDATPWTWGALADIAAASAITVDFCVIGIIVANSNQPTDHEAQISIHQGAGSTQIAQVACRLDSSMASSFIPIYPVQLAANTRVNAKLESEDNAANTLDVRIVYYEV